MLKILFLLSSILLVPVICFLTVGIYNMSPFLDGKWEIGTCSSRGQIVEDQFRETMAFDDSITSYHTSYTFHPQDTSKPTYSVSAALLHTGRATYTPSYTFSRMYIPTVMATEYGGLRGRAPCVAHKVPSRFSHVFEGVAMMQSSVPSAYFSSAILALYIIGPICLLVYCFILYKFVRIYFRNYFDVAVQPLKRPALATISIGVLFISAVVYMCIRVPLAGSSEYKPAKCVYGSDVTPPLGKSHYLHVRFTEKGGDFKNGAGIFCLRTTSFYGALFKRKNTDTIHQSGLFWHEGLPPYSACTPLETFVEENYFLEELKNGEEKDCYVARKNNVNIVTPGYAKRHVAYIDSVFITLFVLFGLIIVTDLVFFTSPKKADMPVHRHHCHHCNHYQHYYKMYQNLYIFV